MKTLAEIATDVENEYQMGGLFDGIHYDFVTEVAKRYAEQAIDKCANEAKTTVECDDADDEEGTLSYWTVVDKDSILNVKQQLK